MIKKKTYPVGLVEEKDGILFMRISKMITDYRFWGILFYRKELVSPHVYRAEAWDGFYPNP